jgi:hypothetical protein
VYGCSASARPVGFDGETNTSSVADSPIPAMRREIRSLIAPPPVQLLPRRLAPADRLESAVGGGLRPGRDRL